MKSSHKCSLNSINTVYLGTWQWQQALWTQSLWWTCWCVSVQRRSVVGGLRWWTAQKKNHSPLLLAVELCVYEYECGHVRLCMCLCVVQRCAVRQAYSTCAQCIGWVEERWSQYRTLLFQTSKMKCEQLILTDFCSGKNHIDINSCNPWNVDTSLFRN